MSDTCWACGADIEVGIPVCPSCKMPLTEEEPKLDDLDEFFTSTSEDELPAMPQVDLEGYDSAPSMPDVALDRDEKEIVTADEVGKSDDLAFLDSLIEDKAVEDELPSIPDVDFDFDEFDEEEEEEIVEKIQTSKLVELASIPMKTKVRIFLVQWVYWYLIFLLLSLSSLVVTNQNFDPTNMKFGLDYTYNQIFLLLAWISFIPMGFYFGYVLRKNSITPKVSYLAIFILGQFLVLAAFSGLGILLYNPQILSGVYTRANYFITAFFIFTINNFFLSFLSFGIVGLYLSYTKIWELIYSVTPISKTVDSSELGSIN